MIRHGANTIQNVLRVVGTSEDEGQGQPSSGSGSSGVCRPSWEGGQARYSVQRGEKTIQVTADEVVTHLFTLLKGMSQIFLHTLCNNSDSIFILFSVQPSMYTSLLEVK